MSIARLIYKKQVYFYRLAIEIEKCPTKIIEYFYIAG